MSQLTHLALFFFLVLTVAVAAVSAQQAPPAATPPADDTVKVSTALVQIDVVVTDKDGKQVTDLSIDDFKLLQDGKPQTITSLTYVNATSGERTVVKAPKKTGGEKNIPTPVLPNRSGNTGRVITFVLDDGNCLASSDSLGFMRDEIKKFVDKEMLPDDKVAIYRTKGGASLMQMYTSNNEVLKKQLNRINLFVIGACGSSFDSLRDQSTIKATGKGATSFESEDMKEARLAREGRERDNQIVGTIGVINFVVDRLKNIPQRKMIFLVSDGIIAKLDSNTYGVLRELSDKAARASVVINTMSAKGLTVSGMLEARDEVLPGISGGIDETGPASEARRTEERELNEGISYLAYSTGGKFVRNTNGLSSSVRKVLDANAGYYLVGYEPTDETFKGKDYHKIDVDVLKPDLRISFRRGFYGQADAEKQTAGRSADSPLYQAINSPFDANGLDIQLTTLTGSDAASGNYARVMFHIPGPDIAFQDEPNGTKKMSFDVIAVALDVKGKVAEEFNRTYPIRIPARGVETISKFGLDFTTDIPFKKGGIYTFRLAVRDNVSKRLGSAGDFVDIPDSKSSKLSVTGLSSSVVAPDGKAVRPPFRPINAAFAPIFSFAVPSVRIFAAGSVLPFVFTVNNPKVAGGTPELTKEIRLYSTGGLVTSVEEQPLTVQPGATSKSFDAAGELKLGADLAPGDYVMQIIIRDKKTGQTDTQSLDFTVE